MPQNKQDRNNGVRTIRPVLTYTEARMVVSALHEMSISYFEREKQAESEGNNSFAAYLHILGLDYDNLRSKIEQMYP